MRELKEDTFSENKNDDAHEHMKRVLDIVNLFNIPGVTHDVVMLQVFPITLTGAAKRWVDRLSLGTVNSWDLLKKAFIHRNIDSGNSNSEGIAAIVSKLDSLGKDMEKLKENVHAIQEQTKKKARMFEPKTNDPSTHFCKPVKQNCNGVLKVWPTCDPTMKLCNGGKEIYGMNEQGDLQCWYCYLDHNRENMKGVVGHTDVSEPVKRALLKTWVIDCFQEELVKDPQSRSFDNYNWMFDLEIDQLAEEYELGIGKKGHMLDDIWEKFDGCFTIGKRKQIKVQGDDPKGSGHGKEGLKKTVKHPESNLKTHE
ncbi:hypothetical protein Tco_0832285 [Tanacetum coccineum]